MICLLWAIPLSFVSFLVAGYFLFTPKVVLKDIRGVDSLLTWAQALCGLVFGGIFKTFSIDWMKIGKSLTLTVENFEFKQKDLDDYSRGLQLTNETQGPKFGENVPVGLLVTIGVRACYASMMRPVQKSQHFHFFGLVVRSFKYESSGNIKINQKLKIEGSATSEYAKRGIDVTASAKFFDQETGELLGNVNVTFLKPTKHGKKIEKKQSSKKEFLDENKIDEEIWKTDTGLPGRWLDISGDPNPIHMHPLLGMLFGLPSSIVHGTWIFSKAMVDFENKFIDSNTKVEMKFIKPLIVGKKATFKTYSTDNPLQSELAVWGGKKGKERVGSFATILKLA